MTILGIMSGSSLDGLDLVVCNIKSLDSIEFIVGTCIPFNSDLKQKLNDVQDLGLIEFKNLEVYFTRFVAESINAFLESNNHQVDCLSFHGHTIFHNPNAHYSIQMGNIGMLAELCKLDTIGDFRSQDMANQGQGAPLAPLIDKYLFKDYAISCNLGGIANLTYNDKHLLAFDVCPCNQLLNLLASKLGKEYDDKGAIAASGKISTEFYAFLNKPDYYEISGPKSLDNIWITKNILEKLDAFSSIPSQDLLFTSCDWISDKIQESIQRLAKEFRLKPQSKMLVAGGGAHNKFLMSKIKQKLEKFDLLIDSDNDSLIEYKEGMLMCLLAFCRFNDITNCFSSVTGATKDSISGAYYIVNRNSNE